MRLDKALADMGISTRHGIKKIAKEGRITLNNEVIKDTSVHIDPEKDIIAVDGQTVEYRSHVYFMLNKPKDCLTAASGAYGGALTVMDLIDEPYKGLYPVGRLDRDTVGLLLITNDGPLGHDLLSPRKHVEKEYEVTLAKEPSEEDFIKIRAGITFEGETFLPAEVTKTGEKECHIILHEGKYHEVKRIFQAVDNQVKELKRVRMKNLVLDETLKPGQYRALTDEELADLKGQDL